MRSWAVLAALVPLATAGVLGATLHLSPAAPPPAAVPVFAQAAVDPVAPGSLLLVREAAPKAERFAMAPVANATLAPPGPRFGRDGMNATVLTFYAFTNQGRLVASDADPAGVARFRKDGDFVQVDPVPLYLGAGTAPNGTTALPHDLLGLRPLIWAALAGQPEGGTVALPIRQGVLADLYGPTVFVAMRVDRLLSVP